METTYLAGLSRPLETHEMLSPSELRFTILYLFSTRIGTRPTASEKAISVDYTYKLSRSRNVGTLTTDDMRFSVLVK